MDETMIIDTTATGVSETPELAAGSGGTSRESSSLSSSYPENSEEVRQASAASNGAGTATVGSAEKQDTTLGRNSESATVTAHVGENGGAASQSVKIDDNKSLKSRIIDIGTLGEAKLLSMIQHYVTGMNTFEANTRNVHKELKETLAKTCMLLKQYTRVKNQGPGDTVQATTSKQHMKSKGKNVATQTTTKEGLSDSPLMSTLVGIQDQLLAQQRSINQLFDERNRTMRSENQQQDTRQKSDRVQQFRNEPAHPAPVECSDDFKALAARTAPIPEATALEDQAENVGKWSEVVKRNKKASKVEGSFTKEASRHSVRNRPAAIVIDAGSEEDFPALARKIKSGISAGNNITETRMTKKGRLLLEVRGDQDAVDSVMSEVTRAARTGANVR